jgi:outer membrane protein
MGLAAVSYGQAPASTKVGVINIQAALVGTKDGQKAAAELDARRAPKQKELEAKQNQIAQLREQLNKGSNTMAPDQRERLMREIDQRTKSLNRDVEDAQADMDQEQQKILQDLGQKMMTIIDKYARDNGFHIILDISSPQTPVLFATNAVDITQEIVKLYDAQAPAAATPPATSAAPPAAAPKPGAATTTTTPAGGAITRPPASIAPGTTAPKKK